MDTAKMTMGDLYEKPYLNQDKLELSKQNEINFNKQLNKKKIKIN